MPPSMKPSLPAASMQLQSANHARPPSPLKKLRPPSLNQPGCRLTINRASLLFLEAWQDNLPVSMPQSTRKKASLSTLLSGIVTVTTRHSRFSSQQRASLNFIYRREYNNETNEHSISNHSSQNTIPHTASALLLDRSYLSLLASTSHTIRSYASADEHRFPGSLEDMSSTHQVFINIIRSFPIYREGRAASIQAGGASASR